MAKTNLHLNTTFFQIVVSGLTWIFSRLNNHNSISLSLWDMFSRPFRSSISLQGFLLRLINTSDIKVSSFVSKFYIWHILQLMSIYIYSEQKGRILHIFWLIYLLIFISSPFLISAKISLVAILSSSIAAVFLICIHLEILLYNRKQIRDKASKMRPETEPWVALVYTPFLERN